MGLSLPPSGPPNSGLDSEDSENNDTSTIKISPQETLSSISSAPPEHTSLDSSFRCSEPTRIFAAEEGPTVAWFGIESYIPVGCLRISRHVTSISSEVWNTHTSWAGFASTGKPVECGNEVTLAKEVQDALSEGLKKYGYKPSRRDLCKYGWVRMEFKVNMKDPNLGQVRVFVLPDDIGRINCPRNIADLRNQLFSMLCQMDISPDTFNGSWDPSTPPKYIDHFYNWTEEQVTKELSLLHIFNHLPSPNPVPHLVTDRYASDAMRDLLANDVRGLRANLFRFQGRTAATMIQREAQPSQHLDPRLMARKDQAGNTWYVNMVTGEWLRQPRFVDDPRGGVLAEHMGRGKTLICLALVMATRNHYPDMPVERAEDKMPIRPKVASLKEMAAAGVGRSNAPWRSFFEDLLESKGEDYSMCVEEIRRHPSHYFVNAPQPIRISRHQPQDIPPKKVFRAPTTIVVVPTNLVDQWLDEIEKHTTGLKVLVMKEAKKKLPPPQELVEYDLLLFSRRRLEQESVDRWIGDRPHDDDCGLIRSPDGDCNCTFGRSPLLDLHFKRIITDEGHFIGNSGGRSVSKAVQVMNSLAVDARWVVSGTPTQGLYGVESYQTLTDRYSEGHVIATENDHKQQQKDVEKIGNISTAFLKSEPWTSEPGSWTKFNMQVRYGKAGSFSVGEPERLRTIMENTVLRTRAKDLESEIALPDLHQTIVYLDASVQDAIQLNIFVLNIISNAVTSERQDADYLFHPKHRNTINELVRNLRQTTFFWSGLTVENVLSTMNIATEFLSEPKTPMSGEDEALLREALAIGENILKLICSYPEQRHLLAPQVPKRTSPPAPLSIFEAASTTDEVPIYVRNEFPEDVRKAWALDESDSNPTLLGFTQLKALSDSAISQLWKSDPLEGLSEAGIKAMESCREPGEAKAKKPNAKPQEVSKAGSAKSPAKPATPKGKSPAKGKNKATGEKSSPSLPTLAGGATAGGNVTPRKPRRRSLKESNESPARKRPIEIDSPSPVNNSDDAGIQLKSAMKKTASAARKPTVDPDSKLASAQIESTASAKLTYLIGKILAVKDEEKSIIFYEEEAVGYYLAQALEAIGVEYLIYAKARTLSSALQSRWLRKFADEDNIRVLLMDLGAGTFGLDISCASRVFFVNPVFNPQIEAQAIKRAHRIGQTKSVYVEVLVMKGTMEEKILERRKQLSDGDFSGYKSILDDGEMLEWVKNPKFLALPDAGENIPSSISKLDTMAKLDVPHRIFGALIQNTNGCGHVQDNEVPEGNVATQEEEPARNGEAPRKMPRLKLIYNPPVQSSDDSATSSEPPKKKTKTVGFASSVPSPEETATDLNYEPSKKKAVGFTLDAESTNEAATGTSITLALKTKTVGFASISSSTDAAAGSSSASKPPKKKKKSVGFASSPLDEAERSLDDESPKKKTVGFAPVSPSSAEGSSSDNTSAKKKTVGFAPTSTSSSSDAASRSSSTSEPPRKKKKTVGFKSPSPEP